MRVRSSPQTLKYLYAASKGMSGGYDYRVPEDSLWCISKHLGGKYHAYEVLEKLIELAESEQDVPVLSRDIPALASKKGETWDVVWLRLVACLDVLDRDLEEYLSSTSGLRQLLNVARDLRRAVQVFRIDYNTWRAERGSAGRPAFESAILQEAMYVRDHLLSIEEHVVEVLEKYAFSRGEGS